MISILIPTFNYNVLPLAQQIEKLAIKSNTEMEIICFDDGSQSILNVENEKINSLKNGKFIAQLKNVGLSNNRNNLVEASNHRYLLFIDGDSEIINDNYINNYINAIEQTPDVVYGGRIHPDYAENKRKLRWKYGKFHEDTTAITRQKEKYKSTLFNNTLISRDTFHKIHFNKDITQYGHEDTIFAYKLSLEKANILHIENPVLHGDVDLNTVFFYKMHKSIENLSYIYKNSIIDIKFITFLKVYSKIKKYRLHYLFLFIHQIFYPLFKLNLTSNYPFLFIFNLFRLSYFCNINLKK